MRIIIRNRSNYLRMAVVINCNVVYYMEEMKSTQI